MGGKACIRGLRVTVGTIIGLLAAGAAAMKSSRHTPTLSPRTWTKRSRMQPGDLRNARFRWAFHESGNPGRHKPQKVTQRNPDTKPINAVNDAELSNFFDRLGSTADSCVVAPGKAEPRPAGGLLLRSEARALPRGARDLCVHHLANPGGDPARLIEAPVVRSLPGLTTATHWHGFPRFLPAHIRTQLGAPHHRVRHPELSCAAKTFPETVLDPFAQIIRMRRSMQSRPQCVPFSAFCWSGLPKPEASIGSELCC